MTREDLLEILPGLENFKIRKSLLRHIESVIATKQAPTSSSSKISQPPSSSNNSSLTPAKESSRDTCINVASPMVTCTKLNFPIYWDQGLCLSSSESRNRLIRNTITSMRSITNSLEKREPENRELNEMAKALIQKYPALRDDKELNPDKPHEGVLLLLKRRLSNAKPVKKRQGPCHSKGRKKLKLVDEEKALVVENGELDEEEIVVEPLRDEHENSEKNALDVDQNEKEMSLHYKKLQEKMNEKKPNPKILSQLLDLEFKARRNYIESLSSLKPYNRVESVLKAYPCFSSAFHVLEEMQRELNKESPFLEQCAEKMSSMWEKLYLFGVIQKVLELPSQFMNSDQKAKVVVLKLCELIPGMKRNVPIATEIGESGDIDKEIKKKVQPTIYITNDGLYVAMYGRIFSRLRPNSFTRAVMILIGLFYTFRLEYIPGQENVMLFLQAEVLDDKIHEKDLVKYQKIIKSFKDFAN